MARKQQEGRARRGALAALEQRLSGLLMVVGTLAIYGMLLVVMANATSRQLLGSPLRGAFEVSQLLMPVVVFGGMAWTFTRVGHFRMTAVIERLGPRLARAVARLQLLIALGFFILLARLQYQYAVASWLRREFIPGIVSIPVYPTKAAIAVGCAVAAIALLAWLLVGRQMGDQELDEVR